MKVKGDVFFRMDDLGWYHGQFLKAIELFRRSGQKLNVAAIPMNCHEAFSTNPVADFKEVIQIHTHGFTHLDHQNAGKKAEFGSHRHKRGVLRDLLKGKQLLESLFGDQYYPAFIPPWNRMDSAFFPLLVESQYRVLSRDGASQSATPGLIDINVSIDVHTKKGAERQTLDELWEEILKQQSEQSHVGIMLHHKYMSEDDFKVLQGLIERMDKNGMKTYFFEDLVNKMGVTK